ncbi:MULTISPECIES: trehalose-phosphatase [unclassified Haladaptatus]|uniref:trehalose-phosphatase n=1 Tax=unclassified Haladaptatus TaxID=2622732 RepID=UPI00209BFE50|nr:MULTISPECIES: trehalose-phosphatase [unclassified Haladaptatus]MCO8246784.1 trehalose-phosphatase [Haladaptatus sp. AB643]MCO8253691.1 trehalose-phosphatase [Haladaptatus sp. AB618]
MNDDVPEPLRHHLYALVTRLRDADGMLAMFDFDGSLAPIEDHPDEVMLPPATRVVIEALRDTPDVEVGIVSGRGLDDLRERVDVDGIAYAGNHGLELFSDGDRHTHSVAEDAADDIARLCSTLESRLDTVDGAFVEDKGVTASIHYRLADDDRVPEVRDFVRDAVRGVEDVRVTTGKQVIELRPDVEWHKGRAIRWLYGRRVPNAETWLPLYVGDDRTDEDAFDVLPESGLGVKVGHEPPTVASYRVADPAAVRTTLAWLAEYGVEFLESPPTTSTASPRG